eukprot:Blabericola_migrator_1__3353@NODE_1991_length_3450_cov_60_208099_g1268_i0_p2_GENE_NODE_1991_length_3450_cov_60_208099_g1268_i0NODE_1991_length_3450_cov_60_208099_g1268_i0_p2_ORF_typecomplete_len360_score33_86_NODE_1991_length_3450_cov_60_208099_g1268_i020593138
MKVLGGHREVIDVKVIHEENQVSIIKKVNSDDLSTEDNSDSEPAVKKHVRWAAEVTDREDDSDDSSCGTKGPVTELYKQRIIRRIWLRVPPAGYLQCRQNIHKILFDANVACNQPTDKIRAARRLLPGDWIERSDCILTLPFQKLLCMTNCASIQEYPLWAHYAFNLWLKYDLTINIEPLILATPMSALKGGHKAVDLRALVSYDEVLASVAPTRPSRVKRVSYRGTPESRLSLRRSEAMLTHSWHYLRYAHTRPFNWIHNTVARTSAYINTLITPSQHHLVSWPRTPQLDDRDVFEELGCGYSHSRHSMTPLHVEIRFFNLVDLAQKLQRLKHENPRHPALHTVVDELTSFFLSAAAL